MTHGVSGDRKRGLIALSIAGLFHLALFGVVELTPSPAPERFVPNTISITTAIVAGSQEDLSDAPQQTGPMRGSVADPMPVEPAPLEPAPVDRPPVEPAAVEPTSGESTPIEPAPIEPAPMAPTPVEPAPVESAPTTGKSVDSSSPRTASSATANDRSPTIPTIEPSRRYVAPRYPERAQEAGIEGTVTIRVEIGRGGRPETITVVERSNSKLLDREAVRTAGLWRYSRKDEGSVSIHRVVFQLEG